jgi:hypothetical protein
MAGLPDKQSGAFVQNLDGTWSMRTVDAADGATQGLQRAPFGELAVAQPTPRIALSFPYALNPDKVNLGVTGSGTTTQADSMAVLSTTAATNSSAELLSHDTIRYIPGQGVSARFTALFTEGVAGSEQYIGIGTGEDGYFVGIDGADGLAILHRIDGADTWHPRSEFNDPLDGTGNSGIDLDITKGNVFKIDYQWLGFGTINFYR